MARKKKEEKKEEKEDFQLEEELEKVNFYLREGLQKYILQNGIIIKTKREFEELKDKYGGF